MEGIILLNEINQEKTKRMKRKNSKISKFELKSEPIGTRNNKNRTTNYINGKAQTT